MMDDVIYLDIEYIHPGPFEDSTTIAAKAFVEYRYQNALRVDLKSTEIRGGSKIFVFRAWINDPKNMCVEKP